MCKTVLHRAVFVLAVLIISAGVMPMLSSCATRRRETAFQPQNGGTAVCLSFLASNGWKTEPSPCEISVIRIPDRFNAVFDAYNGLQRAQGFDLAPYRGRSVTRFVFRLTEYPGAQNADCIRATVYVYNGSVIGGDISSTALDGFMHGIISAE